jgi:PAS domain S-box-containing protein
LAETRKQPDRIENFLAGQNQILEKIAIGAPLLEILSDIVHLIESQTDGMLCSILLLDDDGVHLRHGAAPSFPKAYVDAIDGIAIGPKAGSCGAAVYFNKPMIVTDVHDDPLWAEYREIAAKYGFRACWSSPVRSHTGQPSGAFAMYSGVPKYPCSEDLRLAEVATHIASVAIESRRAAESLRRSEERSQAILNAIPDSMCLFDSSFTLIDCHSRGPCQAFIPKGDAMGQNICGVLPPELAEGFARGCQKASLSGQPQLLEYDFSAGGQTRYAEARIVPTSDGKFLALVRDTTERKAAEQALTGSEERFRLVAMATRDGIYDCDLRTHRVWRNEAYHVLFSAGEPMGVTQDWWKERIHPADRDRVINSIELAFRSQTHRWSAEYLLRRGSGDYATVVDRCHILYDEDGQPLRLIGAVTDISERRSAEEALQSRERELRRRNIEIRELAGKLMTAQEEERRRISRELHDDLNQKVAALSMRISKLKNQVGPDETLKIQIDRLQKSSVEIAADIRRLSHELHSAVLEHVGLAAALKAYVAEFSRLEKVQVGLTVPDAVESIPKDVAVCLYRVAQESLRNVVKHAGVNYAEMKLSVDDKGIHLHVSDSGLGFDLVAARDNGGLGLASMEERVRLVQGSFKISTQPGCGSQLSATIPLRK